MSKVVFENESTSFLRIAWPQPALKPLIAYYFEVDATASIAPVSITGLPAVNTLIAIDLNFSHFCKDAHSLTGKAPLEI